MSKRLKSLILVGALSLTFLTGCQSTETEVDLTNSSYSEQDAESIKRDYKEHFEGFYNLSIVEQNIVRKCLISLLEGRNVDPTDENVNSIPDKEIVRALLLDIEELNTEYANDKVKLVIYQVAIQELKEEFGPLDEVEETKLEVKETKCGWCEEVNCVCSCYSCGAKVEPSTAYYNGRSFRCSDCEQAENQPAEVDCSETVAQCENCGSTNIDVVDNTGSYICLDCGYWE